MSSFSTYVPGYALLTSIIMETYFLFTFSIFFYHKFVDYSTKGSIFKKNMILTVVAAFFLLYNGFIESPTAMIPHFLSRFSCLLLFLMLVKYFWVGNPLSHLFGILIYFQLDRIFRFIHLADPTIKSQGWILLILLAAAFIYTVGFENIRGRISSKTA